MNKWVPRIARYVLGLIYFLSGLAGLLNLMPPPKDMPEALMTFMSGMMAAKYFFPLLKGTETVCGFLLLSGFAPALALIVLAPITVNIILVHSFLTPGIENLGLPILMVGLHVIAAVAYKAVYVPLFLKNSGS